VNAAPARLPESVPVFPLPEVVLFPRQVLPLHVFEPRYRAMIADALQGDRMLAIALLKPHYEPHYFSNHAPIHRLVGVGRIIAAEPLPDGKYNILLRGEARALIVEELNGRPYRLARIRPVQPRCDASPSVRQQLRQELFKAVRAQLHAHADACAHYLQLFEMPLSLDELTDLIAGALPISGEQRQRLLAELDPCARVHLLLEHIHTLAALAPHLRQTQNRSAWSFN